MKVYEGNDIRNVGLIGHGHAGKTQLAAALLHTGGATPRLTQVEEGNTITDFDEEEAQRKMSISSSVASLEYKKNKLNLLDTPGFGAFLHDTRATLAAVDAALVVVDGIAGVEAQTEKVVGYVDELELPHAFVINKLDRERSSFSAALESIQKNYGRNVIPLQLPLGCEKDFRGVVDIVRMVAWEYAKSGDGKGKETAIPDSMADAAQTAHEALIEMVAEGNDELMQEFFDTGTLPVEHIVEGMQNAIREDRLFPVLCSSSTHNIGTDQILDFVVGCFPAPTARHATKGTLNGAEMERAVSDDQPCAVQVFKTVADPFQGRISYFKVMSGMVKNDDHLMNTRSNTDERFAHLSSPQGKNLLPVTVLHAGDIGAVAKLRDTLTGDTLADKKSMVTFAPMQFPEPSIAYAIAAATRADEDRMGLAIHRILEEDPSLRFYRDPQTKEFLLGGSGQQHVEIICSRLKRRYHVDVTLRAPKIPYRETIRGRAEVQGRHKKQTGGHGQFGDCWIRMEPLGRGEKFQFANEIFGGSIPRQYVPAVEKGIVEAAEKGYLAGYPVVDFKVTVFDGSYHDVDSNELSFKLAARKAFRAAMEQCKPVLLEPVMNVEVQAPVEFAGDLMGDLNGRRGRISGMDVRGSKQLIRAQVPMSEMLTYQNDLTSMTQGRASFSMEFDHYDAVPSLQADKIIAAAKAARSGEVEEEE